MIGRLIAAVAAALKALALGAVGWLENLLRGWGRALGIGPGQSSIPAPPAVEKEGPSPEECEAELRRIAAMTRANCAIFAAGHGRVIPPDLGPDVGAWLSGLTRQEAAKVALQPTTAVLGHLGGTAQIRGIPPVCSPSHMDSWRQERRAHLRVVDRPESDLDLSDSLPTEDPYAPGERLAVSR